MNELEVSYSVIMDDVHLKFEKLAWYYKNQLGLTTGDELWSVYVTQTEWNDANNSK